MISDHKPLFEGTRRVLDGFLSSVRCASDSWGGRFCRRLWLRRFASSEAFDGCLRSEKRQQLHMEISPTCRKRRWRGLHHQDFGGSVKSCFWILGSRFALRSSSPNPVLIWEFSNYTPDIPKSRSGFEDCGVHRSKRGVRKLLIPLAKSMDLPQFGFESERVLVREPIQSVLHPMVTSQDF